MKRFPFYICLLFIFIEIRAGSPDNYICPSESPRDYQIYNVLTQNFEVGKDNVICSLFFLPSFNDPDPFAIFIKKKSDSYVIEKCIYHNKQTIIREYPIDAQLANSISKTLQTILPHVQKSHLTSLDGVIYLFECISVDSLVLRGEVYSNPEIPPESVSGLLMSMTDSFGIGMAPIDYVSIKKIADKLSHGTSWISIYSSNIFLWSVLLLCVVVLIFSFAIWSKKLSKRMRVTES